MTTGSPTEPEQRPVFVDGSGRRMRRLRVAGAIVVVPAVGYVCVLFSTLLGGPTVLSPFLPLPDPPAAAAVVARPSDPAPQSTSTSGPAQPSVVGAVSTRMPASALSTTATASPTAIPSPSSTARGNSAALPNPMKTSKGKPTVLPAPLRRPAKP